MSARDRRALLVGAATVLGLVGLERGVPAWRRWHGDALAGAAELTREARRARSSVAAAPALADTLVARRERFLALAPAVIAGDSPALAAGVLADLVSGAAASAGVRLGSVQLRSDSAKQGMFTPVAVSGSGVGDVRGLARLLAALERGPTLLAVRELTVTQPDPAGATDRAEMLRFDFVVEALALNHTLRRTPR